LTRGFKDKVVVITEASERRSGILDGARPTSEDDSATTFELFFDLVYVFAMTQVTGYMVHAHDVLGVLQGLLVLALLWWLYFDVVSRAAEHRLRDAQGQARVRMALEAYTYGHFPIVAGIIVGAVVVEGVLAHADDGEPLGLFYAAALYGGFVLYLAGHLLFKQRMYAALSVARLVTGGFLLLALPAAAFLPPLVGLAGLVLLLGVLIGLETRRSGQAPAPAELDALTSPALIISTHR
jgi:low temperature requirement protein LtrA